MAVFLLVIVMCWLFKVVCFLVAFVSGVCVVVVNACCLFVDLGVLTCGW